MKTKLTVTVDRELLPRAKRAAASKGVSLSSVIESSLEELTRQLNFVSRWKGRFSPADEPVDHRLEYLKEKYLADSD